jgi:hypothetical protein
MRRKIVMTLLLAMAATTAVAQERSMNVRQGPETVFDRPVEQIFIELAGATATNENGRVGNELVFWNYRLADGRVASLFACAQREDVDCDARVRAICLNSANVMRRIDTPGIVRQLRCQSLSMPKVGDLRPGCLERQEGEALLAGLVQCQ